jgi:hypothetical protein
MGYPPSMSIREVHWKVSGRRFGDILKAGSSRLIREQFNFKISSSGLSDVKVWRMKETSGQELAWRTFDRHGYPEIPR